MADPKDVLDTFLPSMTPEGRSKILDRFLTRSSAQPSAPPPAAPPPTAKLPQDFNILDYAKGAPAASAPTPAPQPQGGGPLPNNFNVFDYAKNGAPAPPPAPAKQAPPPKWAKDLAASNQSIDQVQGDLRASDHARSNGVPLANISPKAAAALVKASNISQANADVAYQQQKDGARREEVNERDAGELAANGPPTPLRMVSPGGRTPASWTTQEQDGTHFSPETLDAGEKAFDLKRGAAEANYEAGTNAAARDFAYLDTHQRLEADREQRLQAQAIERKKQYDGALQKMDKLTSDAESGKVDLHAAAGGGVGMFMAGIATMLGAVGQGFMARAGNLNAKNAGLEAVKQSIADNIQAQKDNLANKFKRTEAQRGLLAQMKQTFGDEDSAEEAVWLAGLAKAKTQAAKLGAEAKTDAEKAKLAGALEQIGTEYAQHREKLDALQQNRISRVEHDVNAPAQYAGGGGGGPLDKHDREEVGKMSEAYEKAGIPKAVSELKDIDRAIDTLGTGDIPGVGAIASRIPDVIAKQVYGDRAIAGRQAVATIKNSTRKSIAGASLTEGEKKELDKQLEGAHDADSLRRVVQSFRQTLSYQSRNIAAGASDNARNEYNRRYQSARGERNPFNVPVDRSSTPYVKPQE